MSRHSILLYLCLLFNFNILCYGNHNDQLVTSLSTNSIISPDRYENNETFAVADFKITGPRNNYQIDLRIQNSQNQISKECSFNVTTKSPVVKVGGITLRRLQGSNGGSSKVVLAWYDEAYESGLGLHHRPQLVAMNLDNCRSKDLGLKNLVRNPIVMPVAGGFEVYLSDPINCKKEGERCKFYYNPNFLNFGGPSRFEVDLDWSTLKLEPFYGQMLAHGLDAYNTYRVLIYDDNYGYTKTIMSWSNADPQLQVVVSSFSVCWVANPNVDKIVNCSLFDGNGKVIFTKATTFDIAVTPIAVRYISNNELFLLVGETSCSSERICWNLKWTRVSKDSNVSVTKEFACTGDRKSLVISDIRKSNGKLRYWYTCRNENLLTYKVNDL